MDRDMDKNGRNGHHGHKWTRLYGQNGHVQQVTSLNLSIPSMMSMKMNENLHATCNIQHKFFITSYLNEKVIFLFKYLFVRSFMRVSPESYEQSTRGRITWVAIIFAVLSFYVCSYGKAGLNYQESNVFVPCRDFPAMHFVY